MGVRSAWEERVFAGRSASIEEFRAEAIRMVTEAWSADPAAFKVKRALTTLTHFGAATDPRYGAMYEILSAAHAYTQQAMDDGLNKQLVAAGRAYLQIGSMVNLPLATANLVVQVTNGELTPLQTFQQIATLGRGWVGTASRGFLSGSGERANSPEATVPPPTPPASPGVATIGGRKPINSRYAGQTHPSGVRFTQQGFPDFRPYAQAEVEIAGLTGRYKVDARLANQQMGYSRTPRGYVWHHVEDGTTMQLIPKQLHNSVRHTGGAAIIRNGGFDR
jgi:hypothetical protein